MPGFVVHVAGLEHTVERPVVKSVLNKIKDITGIPVNTLTVFPSTVGVPHERGSSVGDPSTDAIDVVGGKVRVEVSETYLPESISTTAIGRRENIPVFKSKSGLTITPIYADVEVTVNIAYTSQSQTIIKNWLSNIRVKLSQYMDVVLHDLEYRYIVPALATEVLRQVHALEEIYDGYGRTFSEYVRDVSDGSLDWVADIAGRRVDLSVMNRQSRVQGRFDFSPLPGEMESTDALKWKVEIPYTFTYNKPISMYVSYPVSVHNSLMPPTYTTMVEKVTDRHRESLRGVSSSALQEFEKQYEMYITNTGEYLHIPKFDDWVLPRVRTYTTTIFTALCLITPDDKKSLLNLRELGDLYIDPELLDFIQESEYAFTPRLAGSPFLVELIRGDDYMDPYMVEMTPDLTFKALKDLDMRTVYHVRFSIINDFTVLTEQARTRLKNNPKIVAKLIQALNCSFGQHPSFQEQNMVLTTKEFDMIQQAVRANDPGIYSGVMKTILTTNIVGLRSTL